MYKESMDPSVLHGMRISFLLAAKFSQDATRASIHRAAELMAVAMLCEKRRIRDLQELENINSMLREIDRWSK